MKMGGFLDGKVAVITGSTSGIGLGYARALAAEGCAILLNGFGDATEIESNRSALEKEFGVKAIYHDADMRKPDRCASLTIVATALALSTSLPSASGKSGSEEASQRRRRASSVNRSC